MPRRRPFILVLAGVNGAGKSSVGGANVRERGLEWFNPDEYARELMQRHGYAVEQANSAGWEFGRRQLVDAIELRRSHAFETTLGASTIPTLLAEASSTHDIYMWYCGLASPDLHILRVALRVAAGGHHIRPEDIRRRWSSSRRNLIALLPHITHLQVFDNSAEAPLGQPVPAPVLVLETHERQVLYPDPTAPEQLATTPEWAMAVVEAALELARR